jgi:membrane protease subunit (stomatin/prohibitin family)
MGLFESIRGQFIDVIEWIDPSHDTIVYRFERHNNEIKQGAKLTVRPGQQAIFVNEGQIADVFEPGMYTLNTENLPILSTLKAWPYGFNSPFKAEVYFVSTKTFTNLKWGTANPIIVRDSDFGAVRVRAYGNYSIHVNNPTHLLQQLVSTDGLFQVDEIQDHLRNRIVTAFASWLGKSKIPILDFAAHYSELGEQVRNGIQAEITGLGLELTGLLVENVSVPPNVEEAIDKRASMGILGNIPQYSQYQMANAIEQSAQNPAGGNVGLEFGMGMAMAQQFTQANAPQPQQPGPPPPPTTTQWYITRNGQSVGPFTPEQLQQQGLTPQSLVWRTGMNEWMTVSQIPELAGMVQPPAPPTPPAPPAPPPIPQPPEITTQKAEWYLFRSGEPTGPYTLDELQQPALRLSGRTNVRKEGETQWQRARYIPELSEVLAMLESEE